MSDNKRNGRGLGGKGYYIALILCAAAIGITGYVYQQNLPPENVSLEDTQPQEVLVGTLTTEPNVAVVATEPAGETVKSTQPTQSAEPTQPTQKKLLTASPVAGEEIVGYSMEALSYNQTTRDWRVHNGVDIGAAEGTAVQAAAEGEVYTTYEDDTMGYTVVIRHDGGYTTKYASLAENLTVKAGDKVSLGQTIGYVGDTALVETTLGSHVHFGVTYQDNPIDPADFLALGK